MPSIARTSGKGKAGVASIDIAFRPGQRVWMKAMQPISARALIVTAILVIIGGFMVMSPSGAFFAFGLGALLSAFPAIFGTGKPRLIAVILLLCSIGLAARCYPDFRSEQERYRQKKATALHAVGHGGKESV